MPSRNPPAARHSRRHRRWGRSASRPLRTVTPVLEEAGHRTRALTLPGMESRDADRSGITLGDHVAAVVTAIDEADGPALLVGHSVGSAIAHAAVDAGPDRVARAVYVGGFPTPWSSRGG